MFTTSPCESLVWELLGQVAIRCSALFGLGQQTLRLARPVGITYTSITEVTGIMGRCCPARVNRIVNQSDTVQTIWLCGYPLHQQTVPCKWLFRKIIFLPARALFVLLLVGRHSQINACLLVTSCRLSLHSMETWSSRPLCASILIKFAYEQELPFENGNSQMYWWCLNWATECQHLGTVQDVYRYWGLVLQTSGCHVLKCPTS